MKNKEQGLALISLIIITLLIVLAIVEILLILYTKEIKNNAKDTADINMEISDVIVSNLSNKNNTILNEKANNIINPIKLNLKNKERTSTGTEILYINDYNIFVPESLVDIGYDITEKENTLIFSTKDGSYKCVLLQLSDTYVMPTEEEINNFYETKEYKDWKEEDYDIDDEISTNLHYDNYEKIASEYYKNLGYIAQNCPDYVLTSDELENITDKYLIDKNSRTVGYNNVFPGYEKYTYYDWGKTRFYTIPKYYKDSEFGEKTSDISIALYMFEYYNTSDFSINDLKLGTF